MGSSDARVRESLGEQRERGGLIQLAALAAVLSKGQLGAARAPAG